MVAEVLAVKQEPLDATTGQEPVVLRMNSCSGDKWGLDCAVYNSSVAQIMYHLLVERCLYTKSTF